jgi:hypothetical protein
VQWWSACSLSTGAAYTVPSKHGGHAVGPPPGIIENILHGMARSTSPNSFGRSYKRKSWQWLPVSRCSKMCRFTKQSTIPAHINAELFVAGVYNVLSGITHKLNLSGHVLIRTFFFSFFLYVELCPKFFCTIQLHPTYIMF